MTSRPPSPDVVVVGAGHNGLVAAAYLARAGLRPLVLERNDRVGGAVMSGEATCPGFVHDLFATNQNLFLGSGAWSELGEELRGRGLRFRTSDRPYANAFPGGRALRVYRDPERTRRLLHEHSPGDAEGWERLRALYQLHSPTLFALYGSALPSWAAAGHVARAALRVGPGGLGKLARLLLSSTRELGDRFMASPEAKSLVACWAMHLDFGPDVSGGAMFPFLELFAGMEAGMSVVEGGASRLSDALAAVVVAHGGEIRTGTPVERVVVDRGAACGVETAGGERIAARRAVVANVTPTLLAEHLLPPGALPGRARIQAASYAYGPATMVVHLALRGPLPWEAGGDLDQFGYVHVAPYVDDLASTYTEAVGGLLPRSPLLVVGQTTAVDPSRAPAGHHVVWIQVRALPARIQGDSLGRISARSWPDAKVPFAERVLAKLESYAPGTRALVVGRAVLGPDDLEAHDPNLRGGDSLAGSHHLHQGLLFRPVPGWTRYRTPVERLYIVGAATWPGAGVNAVSGRIVARRILGSPQLRARRATRRSSPA